MSKPNNKQVRITQTVSSSGNPSKNSKKPKSRSAKVSAPTMSKPVSVSIAVTSKATSRIPKQRSIRNGIEVDHTEFVMPVFKPVTTSGSTVDSTNLLQLARLRFNPASKKTFEWLSTIAPSYEFFKFKRLEFIYETRSASTTEGSLIMSPEYDAADANAAMNEKSLYNNRGTTDDSVWKHQRCFVDPTMMNRLYKAHPNMTDERFATTTQDEKTIDAGQLFVALDTSDLPAKKYGKLFVRYVVDLTQPQQITEPSNLGGFSFNAVNATITSNSPVPFTAAQPVAQWRVDSNLITEAANLLNLVYPNATMARFNRDYNGIISAYTSGTGINSNPTFYVGSDSSTNAGTGDDVSQPVTLPGITNASNTVATASFRIAALAGQYLKMRSPTYSALTGLISEVAGISATSVF